jgi:ATP-dependent DNA helicase RecG
MTDKKLIELLKQVQKLKCESPTLEIKSAQKGTPEKLFDTLSSFSNQDSGGIILFGVDEKSDFKEVGVYNAADLQKHVVEQCNQMTPIVRPLFTIAQKAGKTFVSAEIPAMDICDRPCYYSGKGRLKGSYTRVGDADECMTEYEIYSYDAFRKKYQDDIRAIEDADMSTLDMALLGEYITAIKRNRPNLSQIDDEQIYKLMKISSNGHPTLFAMMLFGKYPQAYMPQLCITAVVVPGTDMGDVGNSGERFIDNKRIEGTIPQMLDEAIAFVRKNTKYTTIIDENGVREDKPEYPTTAIREAILNALVHRDYSIHTQGIPIQLVIYADRLEITNPGGIYGRLTVDQLGKATPDTRNPSLAIALEVLHKTENRYSGIPTIYKQFAAANLPTPIFKDRHGTFLVCFKNGRQQQEENSFIQGIVKFCQVPRSRADIAEFLGLKTTTFATRVYIQPLIEQGILKPTIPDTPRSHKQQYIATKIKY